MDVNKFIYGIETQFEEGFTPEEVQEVLDKVKDEINMSKFNDAMMGNTCIVKDDKMITYKHDLITGLRCGLENRDMHWWEMD